MLTDQHRTEVKDTGFLEFAAQKSSRRGEAKRPNPGAGPCSPLITIGIPTRNRASLVAGAVMRALNQSYSNIEVLVSDNASTDNTLTTLSSIDDPRLRILTSSIDIGHVANAFKCISEAKGDYLLIIPDDDRISSTFLEQCVELINYDPGINAVVAAYGVFFSAKNRYRPAITSKKLTNGIWKGSEILKELLRGRLATVMLSIVFRTEILRRDGVWSFEYQTAVDELATARILLCGRVGLLNEQCATLTIHDFSESSVRGLANCFSETQQVMSLIHDAAAQADIDEASRRELQELTAHYVAKKLFDALVLYRRQGASIREVARQLRIWRKEARQCNISHFFAALHFKAFVLILLPAKITDLLLSLRDVLQGRGLSTADKFSD